MDVNIYNIPISLIIQSKDKTKGNLYLGNYEGADIKCVQEHKIAAVLTAAKDWDKSYNPKDKIKHMILKTADDVEEYDMSKYREILIQTGQHFEETFDFIDQNLKTTNVLVHCFAGCQRSPTVVIAYIIRKQNIPFDQVFKLVKEKRAIVDPNEAFLLQLSQFSDALIHKNKK